MKTVDEFIKEYKTESKLKLLFMSYVAIIRITYRRPRTMFILLYKTFKHQFLAK